MEYTRIDLVDAFSDIFDRSHGWRYSASCENALLALEAARFGMPVEKFTELYHEFWSHDDGDDDGDAFVSRNYDDICDDMPF